MDLTALMRTAIYLWLSVMLSFWCINSVKSQVRKATPKAKVSTKKTTNARQVLSTNTITDTCILNSDFQHFYSSGLQEVSNDFILNSDGSAVIAGYCSASPFSQNKEGWVAKLNAAGEVVWSVKTGWNDVDQFKSIRSAGDGGFYALGTATLANAGRQLWILKVRADGTIEWSKLVNYGPGFEQFETGGIAVTPDGGFAVAITKEAATYTNADIIIFRFTATGTLVWTKQFDSGSTDWVKDMICSGDSLVISGNIKAAPVNGPDIYDGFVMKISEQNGSPGSIRRYDKAGRNENFMRIFKTTQGYLINDTYADDFYGTNYQHAVTTINNDLSPGFSKLLVNSLSPYPTQSHFTIPTSDGGYAGVLGSSDLTNKNGYYKLNASGALVWGRTYWLSGNKRVASIQESAEGNLLSITDNDDLFSARRGMIFTRFNKGDSLTYCNKDSFPITISPLALTSNAFNWTNITTPSLVLDSFASSGFSYTSLNRTELCSSYPCRIETGTNSCHSIFKSSYGGSGEDVGLDVKLLNNGDYLIAGKSNSGGAGHFDGLMMRTNSKGDLLWGRYFGGDTTDYFSKTVSLADGTLLAIGTTHSYGNNKGEPWLVRVSASGQLIWAKTYGIDATTPMSGINLILLDNNTIAFTAATNDSTPTADAFVGVTDLSGNLIWIRQFNKGKGDRFNTLSFYQDTLYAGGYAEQADKDAVIVRLNKNTGQPFRTNLILSTTDKQDEVTMIEQTNTGIAYAVWSYEVTNQSSTSFNGMLFARESRNGQQEFNFRNDGGVYSQFNLNKGISRFDKDSGFLYLKNEAGINGYPTIFKTAPRGVFQWGRHLVSAFQLHSAYSMDIIQNKGYVFTGTKQNQQTPDADILLIVSDRLARTGECTGNLNGNSAAPVTLSTPELTWTQILQPALLHSNSIIPQIQNAAFLRNVSCSVTECDSTQLIGDSCSNSFIVNYEGLYNHALAEVIPLKTGKLAAAGLAGFHYMGESLTMILGKGGAPEKVRSHLPAKYSITNFSKVIETTDGNILFAGLGSWTINNGSSTELVLTLTDASGNVIWSKSHAFNTLDHLHQIKHSGDGGFYILLNSNYGFPPLYSYLVKIDGQGNMLWKKALNGELNGQHLRDFYLENNDLYLVGEYYNEISSSLLVAKADLSTNTLIWQKRFRKTGSKINGLGITKVNDTLLITGITNQDLSFFDIRIYSMLCKIKSGNGEFISGFHINSNNYLGNPTAYFFNEFRDKTTDRTANGEFITGQQTIIGADTMLTMTKFDRNGSIKWSKKYPGLRGMHAASITAADGHYYLALNKTVAASVYDPKMLNWVVKMTDSGYIKQNSSGYCEDRAQPATIETFSLFEDNLVFPITVTNGSVTAANSQPPYSRDQPVTAKAPCTSPSACTLLSLTGPDTVCNLLDTVVFSYTKNPECNNSLLWTTDTSVAKLIRITDSTLHILFSRLGSQTVTIALNAGCNMLYAQKVIFIAPPVAGLSLGKDSTLCPGRTIILRAGRGFRTYRWQDGSTDSTYTAMGPGLYHVTVSDICGNQKSDTVRIDPEIPIQLDLGVDRNKCPEDTLSLSALPGMIRYTWSPAAETDRTDSSAIRIFASSTRKYYLEVENAKGCKANDSITIGVYVPAVLQLRNDTTICLNDSIVVTAGNGFSTYQWSTGETAQFITVKTPGLYTLRAKDPNGCAKTDSFRLISNYPLPILELGPDFSICTGTNRQLDAGVQQSYSWSDGSNNRYYPASTPGLYKVTVTNNFGCTTSDSVKLTSLFALPTGFLDSTASFCKEGDFEIKLNANFNRYLWSTGANTSTLVIKNAGQYWVEVTDSRGCIGRDTILMTSKDCLKGLFVPNAFTPNNDRLNNVFKPLVYGNVEDFLFTVYNRYGEKVFETTNHRTGWDGTLKGQAQPSGTFVWTVRYKVTGMSAPEYRNGTVLLIR